MADAQCMICDNTDFVVLHNDVSDYEYELSHSHFAVIQCTRCKLIQLDPMPSQDELIWYYPPEYMNIHGESSVFYKYLLEKNYKMIRKYFRSFIPEHASIIDVGCASGHFMDYMSRLENGWGFTGVEINETAVKMGKELGRNIIHSRFEDVNLPLKSYDLIILNHLVEHVVQPKLLLTKAWNLLKPYGKLYIETPNTDSMDFRLFGKYWGGFHFPRHTYLFSPGNMTEFLKDLGFINVKVSSTNHMFGWALSIQNLLTDTVHISKTNGRMPLYSLIMVAFLPIVLIQKLFGNSAGMSIVAEKT
ncbi:class I SAM-dependent methyltransferase [bacterium]|nr:class I SAM-dependent methyltransferase [bacterium]